MKDNFKVARELYNRIERFEDNVVVDFDSILKDKRELFLELITVVSPMRLMDIIEEMEESIEDNDIS